MERVEYSNEEYEHFYYLTAKAYEKLLPEQIEHGWKPEDRTWVQLVAGTRKLNRSNHRYRVWHQLGFAMSRFEEIEQAKEFLKKIKLMPQYEDLFEVKLELCVKKIVTHTVNKTVEEIS